MKKQLSIVFLTFLFVITSCHTGKIHLTPAFKKQKEAALSPVFPINNETATTGEVEMSTIRTGNEIFQEETANTLGVDKEITMQNKLIDAVDSEGKEIETKLVSDESSNEEVQAADNQTRSGKSVWLIFAIALLFALMAWVFFVYLGVIGMVLAYIFWIAAVVYLIIGIVTLIM